MADATRIDPLAAPSSGPGSPGYVAPASPTGTPYLPPAVAPWAALVVALAALVPIIPGMPPVLSTLAGLVVALGAALGIASPGARKP